MTELDVLTEEEKQLIKYVNSFDSKKEAKIYI